MNDYGDDRTMAVATKVTTGVCSIVVHSNRVCILTTSART